MTEPQTLHVTFTSSELVYRLVINGETGEVEFETGEEEEEAE